MKWFHGLDLLCASGVLIWTNDSLVNIIWDIISQHRMHWEWSPLSKLCTISMCLGSSVRIEMEDVECNSAIFQENEFYRETVYKCILVLAK